MKITVKISLTPLDAGMHLSVGLPPPPRAVDTNMNEVTSGFLSPGLGAASPAPRDNVTSGTHDTGSRDPRHKSTRLTRCAGKLQRRKILLGLKIFAVRSWRLLRVRPGSSLEAGDQWPVLIFNVFLLIKPLGSP